MGDNLFCDGQKYVSQGYSDGWMRSFKGHPEMADSIKSMLYGYVAKNQFAKMLIFFMTMCDYDEEYSHFMIREFMGGYV